MSLWVIAPAVRAQQPRTQAVDANAVFAVLPRDVIPVLQQESFFYVWDEGRPEVRWMASWDTTEEDVDRFSAAVRRALGA